MERLVNYWVNQKKTRNMNIILRKLRMEQSSGDARSSKRDARGGQFHALLPTLFRMNHSTIMLTILYARWQRLQKWQPSLKLLRIHQKPQDVFLEKKNSTGIKTWLKCIIISLHQTTWNSLPKLLAWIKIMYICKIKISPNK